MRFSKMLLPTLRQVPADSDSTSQILMQRGAMIKKVSSGLFTYLPYFNMVLKRVSEVIHNGMANLNAQECKFPILVSKDLLDDSGRWESFGSEMFRLKDRSGKDYAISPTNEEAACQTAMSYITSYNDLPLTVYQIQQKHRDEIRPRCGVMRAREFIMKDAYSFHAGDEDLDIVYHKFLEEYIKIFNTLGIDVVAVAADSGAMGGSGSQEVMALSPEGDAMLAMCSKCGMSANLETVECPDEEAEWAERHAPEKVFTPNIRTIEDLSAFFNVSEKQFAKSMVYKADKHLVVAVLRGDREVNEIKLKRITGADVVEFASFEEIQTKLNTGIKDTGNAMTCSEIESFNKSINIKELKEYRVKVGKSTQKIIKGMEFSDVKRKVEKEQLEKIKQNGGVTDDPKSIWLLDFWGRKNILGLINMPITRHQIVHLNDCFKIKQKYNK